MFYRLMSDNEWDSLSLLHFEADDKSTIRSNDYDCMVLCHHSHQLNMECVTIRSYVDMVDGNLDGGIRLDKPFLIKLSTYTTDIHAYAADQRHNFATN